MVQRNLTDSVDVEVLVNGVEKIDYIKIKKDYKKCLTEKRIFDIIIIVKERDGMKFIQMCIWFLVLNFGVCNQIWSEPVDYWWVIEIIVVIISYLMVRNKERGNKHEK